MAENSSPKISHQEYERIRGVLPRKYRVLVQLSFSSTSAPHTTAPSERLNAFVAATNGAIVNMTKSRAKLAGKQGIRVNAVAPGPVWTPLIPSTMPAEKVKSFGENTLFKRPAQPIELARNSCFWHLPTRAMRRTRSMA